MGNPLRDRHSPGELAATGQVIDFSLKISDFERLAAIVHGDLEMLEASERPSDWRDAEVKGRLSFGFADAQNGVPELVGHVSTTINAVCQRCLGPMSLPVSVDLKLLFGDEASPGDGAEFEVWELDEEKLRPLDLVEETLIMALPLAALHSDSDTCRAPDDEIDAPRTVRPFAALKAQMEKDN